MRTSRESSGFSWAASQRGDSGTMARRPRIGRRKMHWRMVGTLQAREAVKDWVKA